MHAHKTMQQSLRWRLKELTCFDRLRNTVRLLTIKQTQGAKQHQCVYVDGKLCLHTDKVYLVS